MKQILFAASILVLGGMTASAQNLQLHYDWKKERRYFTSTIEQFKPDQWGSTFYFVDFDYDATNKNPSLAYMEISRNLKIGSCPIMAHAEFNGGMKGKAQDNFVVNFKNAFLFGGAYSTNIGSLSLELQLMYKDIIGDESPNAQFTVVWFYPLFNGKVSFDGFFDLWSQDSKQELGKTNPKQLVMLTEPQLWYNFNKMFSVGGEVEISKNFVVGAKSVQVFPTVAVKYAF